MLNMFKLLTAEAVPKLTIGEHLDKFFNFLKANVLLTVVTVVVIVLFFAVLSLYLKSYKKRSRKR